MAANRRGGQASGSEAESAEVAEALDALYALPLDAFTEARDERAKELKKAGAKEAAASVKALRKPTVAAWALNQLARRDPARMEAFLRASEGMREAQKNALGPGGAQGLREAVREQRDRVSELLREASKILDEGGFSAKGAPLDSVRDTLLAAPTATVEALEVLRRGLLTKEVEPGDVTDVLGMMSGTPREAPKEEREPKKEAKHEPKLATKHREEPEEELEEPPPKSETKPKAKRPKSREERLAEAKEQREAREREARERKEAREAEERARKEEKEREEREREEREREERERRERQAAIASARKAAAEAQQAAARERQRAAQLEEVAERAEAAAAEARERAEAAERGAQEAEALAAAAASKLADLEG